MVWSGTDLLQGCSPLQINFLLRQHTHSSSDNSPSTKAPSEVNSPGIGPFGTVYGLKSRLPCASYGHVLFFIEIPFTHFYAVDRSQWALTGLQRTHVANRSRPCGRQVMRRRLLLHFCHMLSTSWHINSNFWSREALLYPSLSCDARFFSALRFSLHFDFSGPFMSYTQGQFNFWLLLHCEWHRTENVKHSQHRRSFSNPVIRIF
jgi:hypothetical protein